MQTVDRKLFRYVLLDLLNEKDYWIAGSPDKEKDVLVVDIKNNTAKWIQNIPGEENKITVKQYIDGKKVIAEAKKWVGDTFREGETAQCMNFVRTVLKYAGYTPGVTKKPSDGMTEPLGEGYANSLAGDDIGFKITDTSKLLPGDIIFFKNTYGNWPEGTITHVGIYTGNGKFVHRPTANKPVEETSVSSYGCFKEARRLFL